MKKLGIFSALLSLALFSACSEQAPTAKTTVVCTTGILGDAVGILMSSDVEVISLMGPGVDPHLYKASQGDVKRLSQADLIVYHGLHLEGKMTEILEKLQESRPVYAAAEYVDPAQLINSSDFPGNHDPHIWFDVDLWSQAISGLATELQSRFPEFADSIAARNLRYQAELEALHQFNKSEFSKIPENQRVLISAHDAFSYLGRAYALEVQSLQGISTTAEYGLQDIQRLTDQIVARKIPAIFVETSISSRSMEAILEGCSASGHEVKLGGSLYSDALGDADSEAGTYIGMFKANVLTITKALQ